jgi:hypothetical protein
MEAAGIEPAQDLCCQTSALACQPLGRQRSRRLEKVLRN